MSVQIRSEDTKRAVYFIVPVTVDGDTIEVSLSVSAQCSKIGSGEHVDVAYHFARERLEAALAAIDDALVGGSSR